MSLDEDKCVWPRREDERTHDDHLCVVQVREVALEKNGLNTGWVAPAVSGRSADDVDDLHALPTRGACEPRRRYFIVGRVIGRLRWYDLE